MSVRRVTIVIAAAVTTLVLVLLVVLKWSQGERLAVIVSSVAAVAAVGVGVFAALPGNGDSSDAGRRRWRVSRTGKATAGRDSVATTGIGVSGGSLPEDLSLNRTGSAVVADGGSAHTGVVDTDARLGRPVPPLRPSSLSVTDATSVAGTQSLRPGIDVRGSGTASAGDHSVVVTGTLVTTGDALHRPHHTSYLTRVRQLHPGVLHDREAELTELRDFCTRPDGPNYTWWQAGPWAGKTALMADLVINPPAGVRIVSFFVVARDAAEADRDAFLDAVIPQLAEIAELAVPAVLGGIRRRDYFWELVEKADAACTRRAERLILLVDGLDEDQGVTAGMAAQSIAGILPMATDRAYRVIVAGRQNPQLPADVQGYHPLRESSVVRPLAASEYGKIVRTQAHAQLDVHLRSRGLDHEILAYVTLARGGLTPPDLAELAGASVADVEAVLNSHSGRVFQLRSQVWSGRAKEVMLAHEELRVAAQSGLTAIESRQRFADIARWAQAFGEAGWPVDSPEYLLTGYVRVLQDSGDVPGLANYVADLARLDRLREASGGDAVGLAQVITAMAGTAVDGANLVSTVRLAIMRDHLSDRNGHLPADILALWVRLGEPQRAESLAQSSTDNAIQARLLGGLLRPLVEGGFADRAGALVEPACAAAVAADREGTWGSVKLDLAEYMVAAGFHCEAQELLQKILAGRTSIDQADDLVALDLLGLITTVNATNIPLEVVEIEQAIDAISDVQSRVIAVSSLVEARNRRGDRRPALQLVPRAIAAAKSMHDAERQIYALLALVGAANIELGRDVATGLIDRAVDLARGLSDSWTRVDQMDNAALAALRINAVEYARSLAVEAREVADTISVSAGRTKDDLYGWLANRLARAGDKAEALATADMIKDAKRRDVARGEIAECLADRGDVTAAEEIIEELGGVIDVSGVLAAISIRDAGAGRLRKAEITARAIADRQFAVQALSTVARYALEHGDRHKAKDLAVAVEDAARSITSASTTSMLLSGLGRAHARVGDVASAHSAFAMALSVAQSYQVRRRGRFDEWELVAQVAWRLDEAEDQERAAEVGSSVLEGAVQELLHGTLNHSWGNIIVCLSPISDEIRARLANVSATILPTMRGADVSMLVGLAEVVADCIDKKAALPLLAACTQLASESTTLWDRCRVLLTIAAAYSRIGCPDEASENFADARSALSSVSAPSRRSDLLGLAVNCASELGQLDVARSFLAQIDEIHRGNAARHIVYALAKLGRSTEARLCAADLPAEDERGAMTRMVQGLFDGGHENEALALCDSFEDEPSKEAVLPAIARFHVNRGEFALALKTTANIVATADRREILQHACEECGVDEASIVVSTALVHTPVLGLVDKISDKCPETVIANAGLIEAVCQLEFPLA